MWISTTVLNWGISWVELCLPQNSHVEVLTLSSSEHDLILNTSEFQDRVFTEAIKLK